MINLRNEIAERVLKNWDSIQNWYGIIAKEVRAPFYCSIDMRDSGFKIAPVDNNLFPAGFNNLCPEDRDAAPSVFLENLNCLAQYLNIPAPKKIVIIPERNTKNLFYSDNLFALRSILINAGLEVEIAWVRAIEDLPEDSSQILHTTFSETIYANHFSINDGVFTLANGFVPDMIVLNNDFSSGYPDFLDLVNQPILPTHRLGWHSRRKSLHFGHYNRLANDFSDKIGIDNYTLSIESRSIENADFENPKSLEEISQAASEVLAKIAQEYRTRKIADVPTAFVKSNMGTYGMGIMAVTDPAEIINSNRRTKNKMSVGKNRLQITSVIVQEGIPTHLKYEGITAEPVMYLSGHRLIGGFLRTNPERSNLDNLNAKGMVFKKLCVSDLQKILESDSEIKSNEASDRLLELAYGSIGCLSALAAGYEIRDALERKP